MDLFKKIKDFHKKWCPLYGTGACPLNWKKKYIVLGVIAALVICNLIF